MTNDSYYVPMTPVVVLVVLAVFCLIGVVVTASEPRDPCVSPNIRACLQTEIPLILGTVRAIENREENR